MDKEIFFINGVKVEVKSGDITKEKYKPVNILPYIHLSVILNSGKNPEVDKKSEYGIK